MKITVLFFLIGLLCKYSYAQDYSSVQYGPESRQYLDIYIAPSDCPTPVYFDAHGNGGNTNMPNSIIDSLKSIGVSIVAWESLTSVNTPEQVQTGWDDAELMFEWVKSNANTYNFDTTQFIIGGSSRGSILSWKYGHNPNPNNIGLYMYNALPSNVWVDSTWWHPPNEVNVLSPPIFFVYKREPGSSMDPVDPDIHDPNNGITIMEKYNQLGIGDRDTLIHSIIDSASTNKYQFLVGFALSIIESCSVTSTKDIEEVASAIKAYPNPFNDIIQIDGLSEDDNFCLRSISGQIVAEGQGGELGDLSYLSSGMYFLIVSSKNKHQRVLKLVKQ